MKTKFLFIILSLFSLSCNKEKREEKKLKRERKDILEVHISNHKNQDISDVKISLFDRDYIASNTQNITNNVEPGGDIMFLYNCQGKIPKSEDYQFQIEYKFDTVEIIEYCFGVFDGEVWNRGIKYDFYEDTTLFEPILWGIY